jgi:hypothetical protein
MQRSTPVVVTAAILAEMCGRALAVENPLQEPPRATAEVLAAFPGAQAHMEHGRVRIIYGVPMGGGATPQASATAWLEQNAEAFGCGALNLTREWTTPVMNGKFTVFGYRQSIDGYPVELGIARVLVLNGPLNQVTYAGGNLAKRPDNGFPRPVLTADLAQHVAEGHKDAAGIKHWRNGSLVVFQGNGDWIDPVLTWKITGEGGLDNAKTFFVDAATGNVVFVRNEISNIDVNGTVRGWASAGLYPPDQTYPEAALSLQGIPELKAGIVGGSSAFADRNGAFTITNAGTTAVTVTSGTNAATDSRGGRWVDVRPQDGAVRLFDSVSVTPPGPAILTLNSAGSGDPSGNAAIASLTAQLNAAITIDATHNYFKDRAPGYAGLDIAIPANTGVTGTCNAFYSASSNSVNFYNAGGSCVNTAYSSIISHEYGHFIVNSLGLAQSSFGEGFGDTTAAMTWNDGITGRGWTAGDPNSFGRDAVAANIQYPCSASCGGEVHCCGQQLAAIWWQLRTAYGTLLGDPTGLELCRSEEVAWSLITLGGINSSNSAGPRTAVEMLTVDDNDGNLVNGTPHYDQICPVFASHSISCPVIPALVFQYPSGPPQYVGLNQATQVPVNVVANQSTPQPGTGQLSYRIGSSGGFTTVSMQEGSPNHYTATLPATGCGNIIQYYFTAQATGGATQTDPADAPATTYSALAAGAPCPPPPTLTCGTIPGTWTELHGDAGAAAFSFSNLDDSSAVFNSTVTNAVVTTSALNVCTNGFISSPARTTSVNGTIPVSGVTLGLWVDWDDLYVDSPGAVLHKATTENGVPVEIVEWYQVRTLYQSGASGRGSFEVKIFGSSGGPGGALVQYLYQNMAWHWNGNSSTVGFQSGTVSGFAPGLNGNNNNGSPGGPLANYSVCTIAVPTLGCYANCDASTAAPVLNIADFACFLNRYAAGDAYANCDGSTAAPQLTVADFGCFLNAFAAGCP